MQSFNEKMILTASNEVLLTFGDLMQSIYTKPNSEENRLMGELILSMRKDLGHSNWWNILYWFDPFRPWIKDINKSIPVRYRGNRRNYNGTSVHQTIS